MKSYWLYIKRNFAESSYNRDHENLEWKNMTYFKKNYYSPIKEFLSLFQIGQKVMIRNNTQASYYFHASEDFIVMQAKALKLFDYKLFEYFIFVEVNFENFSTSQSGLINNIQILKNQKFFDKNHKEEVLVI